MARHAAHPRHWENDRVLSELVLERTRISAARRAEQERLDRAVAALAGSLRGVGVQLSGAELRACAAVVLRSLDGDPAA